MENDYQIFVIPKSVIAVDNFNEFSTKEKQIIIDHVKAQGARNGDIIEFEDFRPRHCHIYGDVIMESLYKPDSEDQMNSKKKNRWDCSTSIDHRPFRKELIENITYDKNLLGDQYAIYTFVQYQNQICYILFCFEHFLENHTKSVPITQEIIDKANEPRAKHNLPLLVLNENLLAEIEFQKNLPKNWWNDDTIEEQVENHISSYTFDIAPAIVKFWSKNWDDLPLQVIEELKMEFAQRFESEEPLQLELHQKDTYKRNKNVNNNIQFYLEY